MTCALYSKLGAVYVTLYLTQKKNKKKNIFYGSLAIHLHDNSVFGA